jgi:hypothetical protein
VRSNVADVSAGGSSSSSNGNVSHVAVGHIDWKTEAVLCTGTLVSLYCYINFVLQCVLLTSCNRLLCAHFDDDLVAQD